MKNLYIIGAGMGHIDDLTGYAKNIISKSQKVYGSARLSNQYKELNSNIFVPSYSDTIKMLKEETSDNVSLLVSGDTSFFSLTKLIIAQLKDKCSIEVIPGISSMQYLLSKVQLSANNVKIVSLHGRESSAIGAVCYNEYTFLLTGGKCKAHNVILDLYNAGLDYIHVYAGENMHSDDERIISLPVKDILNYEFQDLTVLLIHNKDYTSPNIHFLDSDFIRGEAPMTKEDVRWLSADYLNIEDGDTVYDVGAGTGSCAIEFAGRAKDGLVYAIEKEDKACELIKQNKTALKRHNVICVKGQAPEILKELPKPDKVFIGGSSKRLNEIFEIVYNKNNNVVITVTAITLETLSLSLDAFKVYNIEPYITCINSSKSKKAGPYHMMMGNNPVYIITGKLQ